MPTGPSNGSDSRRRSDRRHDVKHWRLWLAVLALTLVPAAIAVAATSSFSARPDHGTVTERSLIATTGATDLLVREQQIEARLASVATNHSLSPLADGVFGSSDRQLDRRATAALDGSGPSLIAGACITRIEDGRQTKLGGGQGVASNSSTCASGSLLARVAGSPLGVVHRSLVPVAGGERGLLIATRIADGAGDDRAVLAATVDLVELFAATPSVSRAMATTMLVDTASSRLIAGSSGSAASGADRQVPSGSDMSIYVNGILAAHEPTMEHLARGGMETTVSSLLQTSTGSRLGLIYVWAAARAPLPLGLLIALIALAIGALIAAIAVVRHVVRPVQDLEESQAQLAVLYREARNDSLHDGLTGMGNHRSFQDELSHQVELSERDGAPFVLLLVDLDNLKAVNDREGHAEGDRLLTSMSGRMREAFRETDRLFRIGGDEFAVLMPDTEPEEAAEVAERLRHFCLRPATGERPTPFSGGISAVPRFALDSNQTYRQADVALYWAKRHGRGFVEVFDPERDRLPDDPGPDGVSNAVYEIARGHIFAPVFQPLVDLRTGVVLGFEGLVRPDPKGPFPDAERLFTAAAATGRTVELDLACLEAVAAGASGISGDHIVSLNLSSKTLEVKDFDSGWLLNTLIRHGISPSRVIVELTERDPIGDLKRLQRNVRHLGEYGVRLAADDVGAGNAGLRLLSEVPFDIVKIDLSLIQSGAQHAASWAVLRSLRDLALRQDALVIGEGVETPEQLRALRQLDIPIGQGYLLGRPGPQPNASPIDLGNPAALVAADGRSPVPPPDNLPVPPQHVGPVPASAILRPPLRPAPSTQPA